MTDRPWMIAHTPPRFSDSPGYPEFRENAAMASRPDMGDLAQRPWLTQGDAMRGTYLSTVGLCEFGHAELSMVNVPGPFVGAAASLLNNIGDYVAGGGQLSAGETMLVGDSLIGFTPVSDPELADRMLAVVFLA